MSKKYNLQKSLVIVESPAKCKKIEEYLGPGYKCIASFGHLREINSLDNIDFQNGFKIKYSIIDSPIKKKQIEKIRKEITDSCEVILATDDDREGEAIAWHICELFDLNVLKTKRILFHEITEKAIKEAIKNPTIIHMNTVYAQQARQVLDLIVGFKVSPLLWTKINKGLSAGRCQTPALKIIYDNDDEIKKNINNKVFNTIGYFTKKGIVFTNSKEYETEEEIELFLDKSISFQHIFTRNDPIKVFKKQPEPFTTSRIQQVCSNKLHISPKETMKICQELYESGYITYMRTDSKKYSKEFIETTKKYIIQNYNNDKYIHLNIDSLICDSSKPHEAIRCTNISCKNLSENTDLKFGSREKRVYQLIWQNTLESCMSEAIAFSITCSISAPLNTIYKCKSECIDFPGWLIVNGKETITNDNIISENDNEISECNNEYYYLLSIKQQMKLDPIKITSKIIIKNNKLHYTEAKLVQILEEKGIGRPSTYSSIVDKIQERGYVVKENIKGKTIECKDYELENGEIYEIETKREYGNENNKLVIKPLGILVIDFLYVFFSSLFNYNYTKQLEDKLDDICIGKTILKELCQECFHDISNLINNVKEEDEKNDEENKKMEIKIDDTHTYIIGKHGPVIKNVEIIKGEEIVNFKPVKKDIDIHKLQNGEYSINEIVDLSSKKEYILGKYEGKELILKKGKYGLYVTWGENQKSLSCFGNRPMENIEYIEVVKLLEQNGNLIRQISDNINIRKGPKGDYIFYKTSKMKKPQFFSLNKFEEDYKKCDKKIIKEWIEQIYKII